MEAFVPRQPVTSFPALLARQRASVSGKLVCAGVFSGVASIREQGRQEENVANPQIRFPLGHHSWRLPGLGDLQLYFSQENMSEAMWPRLE